MLDLQVKKREILGKKVALLRKDGFTPAELYGHKGDNIHLAVSTKEFTKVYKEAGESMVINLVLENKKIPALIYDVSSSPLNGIAHVDFYIVRMDEKIKTAVPLSFIGDSQAVKEGGILVKSIQEIEVEALPGDLPSHIDVNLGDLVQIHDSIYIKDLKISDKVKIFVEPETVIATVIKMAEEEVEVKPASVDDIKVEGEEKKKEAEAGKEAELK